MAEQNTIANTGGMNGAVELVRKWAPAATIIAAVAGSATGVISFDFPPWVVKQIELGGSAIFVLFGVGALILRYIPSDTVPKAVKAVQDNAIALTSIAETLRSMPQKDDLKFESILIGQQMVHDDLERLNGRLGVIERVIVEEHDARTK